MKVGTRELEKIGETLHIKFRSKIMKDNNEERELVEKGAELKLRDEKKYRREVKGTLQKEKEKMMEIFGRGWKYRKKLRQISKDVTYHRNKERERLDMKLRHLRKMRMEFEAEKLDVCPDEVDMYRNAIIFNKIEFEKLKVDDFDIKVVGDINLAP